MSKIKSSIQIEIVSLMQEGHEISGKYINNIRVHKLTLDSLRAQNIIKQDINRPDIYILTKYGKTLIQ